MDSIVLLGMLVASDFEDGFGEALVKRGENAEQDSSWLV